MTRQITLSEISQERKAALRSIKASLAKVGQRFVGVKREHLLLADDRLSLQIIYIANDGENYRDGSINVAIA